MYYKPICVVQTKRFKKCVIGWVVAVDYNSFWLMVGCSQFFSMGGGVERNVPPPPTPMRLILD